MDTEYQAHPSAREAEVGGSRRLQGQSVLHSTSLASPGYTERSYLKTNKNPAKTQIGVHSAARLVGLSRCSYSRSLASTCFHLLHTLHDFSVWAE